MKLEQITYNDYEDILDLTSRKNVMKYIKKGETWDSEKVKNFIKYIEKDKYNLGKKYLNYKITNNDNFIGLIEVKDYRGGLYLNIMIKPSEQGKGYFSKAIEMVKKIKFSQHYIIFQVHLDK